jgi:hypothetical protein
MTNSKKALLALIFLFLLVVNTTSSGYSYFDNTDEEQNETLTIGDWGFGTYILNFGFVDNFQSTIDDLITVDPNDDHKYIYSQLDVPSNLVVNTSPINVFGYDWTFWGKGKTANTPTIGYPVLVDRELDTNGIPVHDINPAYSTTPLYNDYNYFVAYDATNTSTNNRYSLRLNYNNRMTTTTTVGQVSNISFYAMLGLSDPDDLEPIRVGQKIYVEVSANGSNWTKIGTPASQQVSSTAEAFNYYSFDVPANLLGNDLYVRIRYNGRALATGYGRLIIDDLVITTQ